MQSKIIITQTVDIHCYSCNQQELHQQLNHIQTQLQQHSSDKIIKIIIFIAGLTLQNYSDTEIALRNSHKQLFKNYSVNILMLNQNEEFKALVKQIEMANGQQYENNYLQLQKISEKALKENVLHRYLEKKFKWSQVKANYFIDRNKVNSLYDVLKYEGYPQWEKTIVGKSMAFHEFCARWRQENKQEEM